MSRLFEKPTDRRTTLVNLRLTAEQVAALDRIAAALELSSRADVLRLGLECLLEHSPTAAQAAAAQLNEGSDPSA